MRNFINSGDRLTLTAPYAVLSGGGMLVGSLFAVALAAAGNAAQVEALTVGHFTLPKATGAITVGAKAYWDNAAKVVTTVSTSNTLIGVFTAAQVSGDATANVRVTGQIA